MPTLLVRICLCVLCLCTVVPNSSKAQPAISGTTPIAIPVGSQVSLRIHGQNFKSPLRVATTCNATVQVESVEPTLAIVQCTLPAQASMGPFGLWVATEDGASDVFAVLADDLPTAVDNGANHSLETAQSIENRIAVDGVSDAALSDFYRLKLSSNQRVAIEVVAQRMGSAMDPVLRLLNRSGVPIATLDDLASGPDCRYQYRASSDEELFIEVRDSRFAGGGRYHLRVGDFPIVDYSYPMAIQPNTACRLAWIGNESVIGSSDVRCDQSLPCDAVQVTASADGYNASAWGTVLVRDFNIVEEGRSVASPLHVPVGISGQLLAANEQDKYLLQGTPGQTVRIASRTRSLGTPTLLQMQLVNGAGTKVAETAVTESDEWSFDFAFPDNGVYTLVVNDLLKRGGLSYGYWIEVTPADRFFVTLKVDPNTRERFLVEPSVGAFALDMQIQRFGYAGAIELELEAPTLGLKILNPTIPASAAEARIYFQTGEQWNAQSLLGLRLVASGQDPKIKTMVNTLGLRRLKAPGQPFPAPWTNGLVQVAGVPASEAFFALESASPISLALPITEHNVPLTLKRINAEFKDAVTVLPNTTMVGWNVAPKIDKDAYAFTLTSPDNRSASSKFVLQTFAEFKGRGRIETHQLPIQWFNPLQIKIESTPIVTPGQATTVHIKVERSGDDPQPTTLKWKELPAGIVGADAIEVAKDQTQLETVLKVDANFASATSIPLQLIGMSKHAGKDFQVVSNQVAATAIVLPARLTVQPTKIRLKGNRDRQQLLATGFDSSDAPTDLTQKVLWHSMDESIVRTAGGVAYPVANGITSIVAEYGTMRNEISVEIAGMETESPIEFENEVLVALSKQGCNSGACHGSPSGKGSFRLSLRAFDQKLDQLTLVREESGRRVNPLEPEQSLLLQKPLMKVAHGGGMQLRKSDVTYGLLKEWIAQGAKLDPPNTARCNKIEILPIGKQLLKRESGGQQLVVLAHMADGRVRDVTHLVAYESSNTSVATVNATGFVTCHQRGESAILARYLEHIESIPLMFVENVPGFEWKSQPVNNYIDQLVDDKLKQMQYLPSAVCSDAEFLRRVYLDVIGVLPSIEETQSFLADTASTKRSQLIHVLLNRPEYAKFWTLKWGDLLKLTSKNVGEDGIYKYHRWIEKSVQDNMPYDEFARQLITGSGSTLTNPPTNFYRTATDMNECVETISQVFLGARLQCAKCHNHPFERWTQDNYYGMGAFFQRVQRRKTQRVGELFVWTSSTGEVTQPRTGELSKPWVPVQGNISIAVDEDRRNAFAQWLVQKENPYFGRIEANRIWSQFFARGIVDPIDDFRDSNPPTNRPLLDALTQDFVEHGYDRKHLIETILNSRTYQSSYQTNAFNEQDKLYFSHQEPRLLSAEQLLDAINQLTATAQNFGNLPVGTKATQLPAPDVVKVDFLKVFGQPERSTVCACERSEDTNLGMAIELFNGPFVYERLKNPNNRFRKLLAEGKPMEDAIRDLYLAGVCRLPDDAEMKASIEHCKTRPDPIAGLEDVCWALMNTDEFLFQH